MTATDTPSRTVLTGAHLVGSVHLPTAEAVFRAAAGALGDRLPRIPDGEVGERYYWLQFQQARFGRTPGLRPVGDEPVLLRGEFDQRPFTLDGSVPAADLVFADLGYAEAALDSYARFAALQDEGVIPEGVRFQVSLPTPAAVVGIFFVPADRAAIEPVYAAALYAELDRITAGIPHDRLAVQWDTAVEFMWIETADYGTHGEQAAWWDDVLGGVVERAAEEASHVPADVPVGFHLCYGDYEEHHFIQPKDTANLRRVIDGVVRAVDRPIGWFHLPVPIERDDAAYFAPLEGLELPAGTELSLGLVHHEDGVEGALKRVEAAGTAVPRFSIATECGLGRGPEDRMVPDLELHRAILDAAG